MTTPLMIALKSHNKDFIYDVLSDNIVVNDINFIDIYGDTALCMAVKSKELVWVLKELVQRGADVDYCFSKPLMTSIRFSNGLAIKELIRLGARMNNSCIYEAVIVGDVDIIKLLLELGAKVTLLALDYAKGYCSREIINILLNS